MSCVRVEMAGQVLANGRIYVKEAVENAVLTPGGKPKLCWLILCGWCGGSKVMRGEYLRSPEAKSCGCLRGGWNRTGLTSHDLYQTWCGMRNRCNSPNLGRGHPSYGGRGIKICPEWDSFEQFVRDVGPRPEGRTERGRPLWTLDRIDVNGDYEPKNVKWSTAKMQAANRRSVTTLQSEVTALRARVKELEDMLGILKQVRGEPDPDRYLAHCRVARG